MGVHITILLMLTSSSIYTSREGDAGGSSKCGSLDCGGGGDIYNGVEARVATMNECEVGAPVGGVSK